MVTRVSETGTLTTIALVIIAIVAVVTVIGILWGARLKAQRRAADRIEQARLEAEGGDAARDADDAPAMSPTAAPTPAPAPLVDEPIAAAPPLSAAPAIEAASAPAATSRPAPDPAPAPAPAPPPPPAGPPLADAPVTMLKGLGPKVAARLAEHGITTVGDLAALDATRAEALDARLGPFTGRMNRDRWIEQARFLAAGDRAGFEAVFGKL